MKIFNRLLIVPILLATCNSCAGEDSATVAPAQPQANSAAFIPQPQATIPQPQATIPQPQATTPQITTEAPQITTETPQIITKAAKTEIDEEGDIFVATSSENGSVAASLISMTDGDAGLRYRRVMRVLHSLSLDTDFVAKAGERLKANRRLKQEAFVLPLMDENGNSHRFEYISNTDQQLYTLNYRLEHSAE